MVSAAVKDLKGKQVAEMPLASEIFTEITPADVATMHSALVRQLANSRTGSANTKTRAEVRGGGAKPWRQKGTGRARAGSRRSPLWAGGGIIFGPKPRDYTFGMPAKMRGAAIRSALAAKLNDLVIVDSFASVKEAKTKAAWKVLQDLQISNKKLLVVVDKESDKKFALSVRNLENVTVVQGNNIGVKELLNCETVLTSQAMIETITKWLAPSTGKKQKSPKSQRKQRKLKLSSIKLPHISLSIKPNIKQSIKSSTMLLSIKLNIKSNTKLANIKTEQKQSIKSNTKLASISPSIKQSIKSNTKLASISPSIKQSIKSNTKLASISPSIKQSIKSNTKLASIRLSKKEEPGKDKKLSPLQSIASTGSKEHKPAAASDKSAPKAETKKPKPGDEHSSSSKGKGKGK